MTVGKIVVGYDGSSDARAAVAWALDEGARTGALVDFVYAQERLTWASAAPAARPDGETGRAVPGMLEQLVASARHSHPGVRTDVSMVDASAALALVDRSAAAAIVVVGSRGHAGPIGRLGSVSIAISAHARCPVVVVRGEPATADPVVAGVDDSEHAQPVLRFAVEQAAARSVPLRVIRAVSLPSGMWETPAPATVTDTIVAGERRSLADLVSGWRNTYPQVKIITEVVTDHPVNALTLVSTTAQLVVVGSRGRGAIGGMLLGSVSQRLLHHSACTVAVVRHLPGN